MLLFLMVADAVHLLLGLALVALLYRTRSVGPYLVATVGAAFPDIDIFLFHLLLPGLHGPLWAHRGITHSIFAAAAFTALATTVGHPGAAAIGYFSHLAMDSVSGGVRLLAPVDAELYGISLGWYVTNGIVGAFALTVILSAIVALNYDAGPSGAFEEAPEENDDPI